MIHRAILGSVERFIAILTEHLAGKWPFWLSPRQIQICPISDDHKDYCQRVYQELKDRGFNVEIDLSQSSLNKKIRNAQMLQFNYILVAGQEECDSGQIDIRTRDGARKGKLTPE